ncbi:MAG: LacI family DNA-binding transcriptional regulator [Treponema sp.]|nr:LacI family DNA-binding transcriptional regulator [Treponema sp.]
MSKERHTVEDVAREAGVSLMTVSRTMNGRPGVGEETRRRVLEIAARMGYRPSPVARGLASRRASSLGIVLPDLANPFFSILAKAAVDEARGRGVNVFIINTDERPSLERAAYASLREERIAGVVVAASRLPARHLREEAASFDWPVLVNSLVTGAGIANVDVDDEAGIFEAVSHLLGAGRRHVAFVAGPRESGSARRRVAGYKAGLAAGGIAFDPELLVRAKPDIEGGMRSVVALLSRERRIDAVIAHNDITAIGVLRGLEAAGRGIPSDVAVIGVDDIPYAALVRPSLSTVRIDIPELGRRAMAALLDLRDGKVFEPGPCLRPELVLRESSGG